MIKKLVCTALIFLLSVTVVVPSYAGVTETKLESDGYSLLQSLGFLPTSGTDEIDFDSPMKKAEFAYILYSAAGYEKAVGKFKSDSYFKDVSDNDYYYDAVNNLAEFGVVSGDGNGNFNPDDYITGNQAIKLIMASLGYDEYAKVRGGYPTGYIACANDVDVTDGITMTGDSHMSTGDIYNLIANACDTRVLETTGFGSGIEYDNLSGVSLLGRYNHITKYQGRVLGTNSMLLSGDVSLQNNEVLIDGKIYDSSCAFDSVVGCDVYFYYDEYAKTILTYVPANQNTVIIEISAEDVTDFANGTLVYLDGEKEKKLKISQYADVAYNSRPSSDISKEDFLAGDGTICLVNNDSSECDAIMISRPKTYVVGKADSVNGVFYDKYTGEKFDINSMEYVFKDQQGRDMLISELSEYDVVTAFVSKDQKFASLQYSNREAEGRVNSVRHDGGKTFCTIGEREYETDKNFEKIYGTLTIGTEGLFPLDIYGRIVAVKQDEASERWGYFTACKQESKLGGEIAVKIFSESGTMITANLNKRIIFDGTQADSVDVYQTLKSYTGMVRYRLTESKISHLYTENKEDKVNKLYAGYNKDHAPVSNLRYVQSSQIFGGKISFNSKTIIIEVPSYDMSYDEGYRLKSVSEFLNENFYYIDAYRLGTESHIANVIVYYENGTTTRITPLVEVTLVSSIAEIVTESGEAGYALYGMRGGKNTRDIVKDKSVIDNLKGIAPGYTESVHNLKTGDVVKLAFNPDDGTVREVSLCYDRQNDFLLTNATIANNWDSTRMIRASVYSEDNGNLWITQEDLDKEGITLGIESIEAVYATKSRVYRCRTEKGEYIAEVASAADIIDYKSAPDGYSKILMFSRHWYPGVIIIYQ